MMNSKNKNFEESFDKFITSSDLKEILSAFNQLCDLVDLNPSENSSTFYTKLQYKLKGYWKAQTLFTNLDKKVLQKDYRNQSSCSNIKALVIGSGPCGLRCAIELALLGARVVVIDKRESFSRNNVLHLWPFVINDLKALGAKIFFGMFCAGSIDHISIRRLQCILFKVALLFGVQFFGGVTFESLILPIKNNSLNVTAKGDIKSTSNSSENFGWRAKVTPSDHIVSNYEFNTIVGADGKTNILGFPRKELRCRLAIAITANFVNKNTFEEAQAEEISGVAFIFNQQFFKDIYNRTGIDLENIVYYKDETHYFVMTAKKHSLLSKGVIKQDFEDPELLLHSNNINYDALQSYAKEAANVATEYKIPNLEFSKNHRGEPDVAVFDFTHMFAAENASKIIENSGCFLLQMLVGDSLLEPFWPTGSGCALGFLSSLDAAWLVRRIGMINNALEQNKISHCQQKFLILEAIAERESIYQHLSQTTPSNMPPNFNTYTLNPRTRYVQYKTSSMDISQILHLYDTDDMSKKIMPFINDYKNINKCDLKNKQNQVSTPNSTKLMGLNLSLNSSLKDTSVTINSINSSMKGEYMLRWFQIRLDRYFNFKLFKVDDLHKSWVSGVAFLCLIHLYSPNSIDLSSINDEDKTKNLETAFKLFEKEFQIINTFDTNSIENLDSVDIFIYLEKIYETLRVLNPNRLSEEVYQHRSADIRKIKRHWIPKISNDKNYKCPTYQMSTAIKSIRKSSGNKFDCNDIEKGIIEMRKEEILRLYTSNFKEPLIVKKSTNGPLDKVDKVFQSNLNNKQRDLKAKGNDKYSAKLSEKHRTAGQICHFCKTRIFQKKHDTFDTYVFHKHCFRCQYCNKDLNNQQFKLLKDNHISEGKFLCLRHFEKLSNISFIREKNVSNTLRDLVLKEDKKLQKLTTRDNSQVDYKFSTNRRCKIKKPKYGLNDYGSLISQEESILPVCNISEKIDNLNVTDIDIYLKKNLLSLRRVNDESDEEYDGSLDESTIRLLSLDVVEPLEENQYAWSLCFNKEDLEYSLKKCQVIRKNRLIYKKYKSKEDSTSDESEINLLVHNICRTSDEDILDDIAISDETQNLEIPRSTDTFQTDNLPEQHTFNGVSNVNFLGEKNSSDNKFNSDNDEVKEQATENKTEINVVNCNISETNKFDNSRNLRQMAKLKFCTEPPKPVSINPKEFISQINHNKLTLLNTPCYLEVAEYLPPVQDVFVTVTSDLSALRAQILVHEKSFLSASILSIHNHDCNFKTTAGLIDEVNPPNKYNNSLNTDYFEDQSVLILKNKCNLPQNIFNEVCDIKDIDSLSVNTEDSSVTHTEIVSENEIFKNNVPLKNKRYQKATLDSELDISMGKFSVDELPFENRFCSNNSLNSIPTSSFNSSAKSDISASSESDGKKYNNRASLLNDHVLNSADICTKRKDNQINKTFKKSKSSKFNKSDKRLSNNAKLSKEVSETQDVPCAKNKLFFNTVTPPHDIELDDNQIKCLEINSQFPFITEGSIPLKNIENISTKFQRINNLHRQLENIEDRLHEFEFRDRDFKPLSNNQKSSEIVPSREKSKNDLVFHEDSKTFNKEKIEKVDERIAMGLIS